MTYLIVFIFGLIIGSFLNALIWRLHTSESLYDRSRCPACHKVIAWYDNIPVISFLILQGKCRKCQSKISYQYPLVELGTAGLFVLAANAFSFSLLDIQILSLLYFIRACFIISVMIVVFIFDLRWYLILDKVTFPASFVLFLAWIIENWQTGQLLSVPSWSLLIGAVVVGVGFFAFQYLISKGKWIGFGDVKLGLVIALALGWPKVIGGIFIAYLLGAVVGVGLLASGKKELGSKLPFGTFLSLATIIMILWGEIIIDRYLTLIGI